MTDTESKQNYNLEDINTIFKIPICYNNQVKKLNDTIINDLELVKATEKNETSIYENVFKPSNKLSTKIIEQFSNYYTTDVNYLKDTQKLIKSLQNDEVNTIHNKYSIGDKDFHLNEIVSLWEEIKGETGFKEKYLYIDWTFAKELNNNPAFLQIMSIYNIASPILSLCLPIFVIIIPFFIIKLKGIELNIKEYIDILKAIISNHAIFKVFTHFHQVDFGQKMYLLLSAAFYIFSIYQNILVCVRFYSNMNKIHNYLFKFKKYLAHTLDLMKYHSFKTSQLTNYYIFDNTVKHHIQILNELYDKINKITPFNFSFSKITEIGHIMYTFYQLYDNETYNNALLYSFGFHGYFSIINQTYFNIQNDKLVKTVFVKKGKPIFKQMYYPKFIDDLNSDSTIYFKLKSNEVKKNDCNLNKNMIISGPNASGKTTTLKTVLINIILSQQIGFGCFDSLKLCPYDNIHCYLNIPDTSGRDSLFQAEARRCKEIIDSLNNHNDESHFCIFDELYSGTNPEEAVVSAFAFMDYIVKNENVTCLLTTHYTNLCKKLSKNKNIKNYNMKTIKKNDNFEYIYLLKEGISKIKGGLKVLHDMNYPKEILENTKM
jgi:hypothetical protein